MLLTYSILVTIFITAIALYIFSFPGSKKEFLISFYSATSILWGILILFVLRNPQLLYGEQRLMAKISIPALDEIPVWRKIKKNPTDAPDLKTEEKVKIKLPSLLASLQELEGKMLEEDAPVPQIKDLAVALDCPQSHLNYLFNYYYHHSFGNYQNALKVKIAIKHLNQGYLEKHTIESLAALCQYSSQITFYLNFKKFTGYSPTEYQSTDG